MLLPPDREIGCGEKNKNKYDKKQKYLVTAEAVFGAKVMQEAIKLTG